MGSRTGLGTTGHRHRMTWWKFSGNVFVGRTLKGTYYRKCKKKGCGLRETKYGRTKRFR